MGASSNFGRVNTNRLPQRVTDFKRKCADIAGGSGSNALTCSQAASIGDNIDLRTGTASALVNTYSTTVGSGC
jgi:hypothetical protein